MGVSAAPAVYHALRPKGVGRLADDADAVSSDLPADEHIGKMRVHPSPPTLTLAQSAAQSPPSMIEISHGETVRFVVTNQGKLLREMAIGDKKTLDGHAVLTVKFPAMEHDEPYMAHVHSEKRRSLCGPPTSLARLNSHVSSRVTIKPAWSERSMSPSRARERRPPPCFPLINLR